MLEVTKVEMQQKSKRVVCNRRGKNLRVSLMIAASTYSLLGNDAAPEICQQAAR